MLTSVTVTTSARLHFGLIVVGEPARRSYGGIGLMVDQPRYSLIVKRAEQNHIVASPDTIRRIADFLTRLRFADPPRPYEIQVHEEIPAHAGLGSGTQLGLAVAAAVSRLSGEPQLPALELAQRVGRKARSAIGTVGFETGGLIFDRGEAPQQPGTVDFTRHDFPENWRFILVTPPTTAGLSGEQELHAFRDLAPMTPAQVFQLAQISTDLQSAVKSRDFPAFGSALFEFGQIVGNYFSPIQGGVLANPRMAALAEKLRSDGIAGVGQTSWGPTLFALCERDSAAESVAATIRQSTEWGDCDVRVVAARNRGAKVEVN